VQPSSLIFLLLIAIWAAYLLQHWVRRREHLATARSVDRFSDAMRVLERRSPLSEFDQSAPRPRSYALSPARPSRPEAVVKPAQSQRTEAPTPAQTAVRSTRVFHVLAGVSARRLRGLSLLGSLLIVLVVSPLAASSVLPWWSVLGVVAVLMADVVWLRHAAVSERARSRAADQLRGSASGRGRAASDSAENRSRPQPRSGHESRSEVQPDAEPGPARAAEPAVAAVAKVPVEVDPYGWAPVPVPPPTYTLKAMAPEPVAAPVAVPELTEADSWSLEGLVYDCDLEELVERRSASGA
jgi:cytoskeletal protein RodZ